MQTTVKNPGVEYTGNMLDEIFATVNEANVTPAVPDHSIKVSNPSKSISVDEVLRRSLEF